MVKLVHRDVHDALELVHAAASVDGSDPFPRETIELFGRLIPCELASYSELDIAARPLAAGPAITHAVEQPAVRTPPPVAEARRLLCSTFPLSVYRRRSETRAVKISDFFSLGELHRTDYYDSVLRPFGIDHQIRLFLTAPAERSRFFSFSRGRAGRDFGERDRTLLELLRPFLIAIREQFEMRQARGANGHAALTEREAEILAWVARGKTNREIASILYVSHHTVRKHLEHAYEKLGVHTRTAAIAQLN